MNSIYERYSDVTGRESTERAQLQVQLTKDQFEKVLIPELRKTAVTLDRVSVLEVGAGWGKNLLALKALGIGAVRGFDISPQQVAQAKELGLPDVQLVSPDGPISTAFRNPAHVVLAIDVLEHLSMNQLEDFAANVKTGLVAGGLLVLQVPNDLAPGNPLRAGDLTHLRSFTAGSVAQFLRLCDLEIVKLCGMPFPGSGWRTSIRRLVVTALIFPVIRIVGRFLYGHADEYQIYDPNIFAVGRKR